MAASNQKQRKQRTISFRCSEAEYQKIDRMAKISGQNRSRYMTDKLLKEEIDKTEMCMLLRTVSEKYYKSSGDKRFLASVDEMLDREGF